MKTYSCGNCGYILPGPVGRCPRCGALLRGEREGDEAERLRREQAYRRNSPEARERREKIRYAWEAAWLYLLMIVGVTLALTVFVGGGAALGWFVLPLLLGREAAIPLTVASAILGGLLLYLTAWKFFNQPLLGIFTRGKPGWLDAIDQEVEEKERNYQWNLMILTVVAYCLSAFLLGSIGWFLGKGNVEIAPIISLLAGLAVVYLVRRIFEFWQLMLIFFLTTSGVQQGLTRLFDRLDWNAQISNPNVSALVGILLGLPLSYFLAKRLADPPPDTRQKRKDAIFAAIAADPSRISDLDSYEREYVLDKLKELKRMVEAAPQSWEFLPPGLQALVPRPQAATKKKDSSQEKRPRQRNVSKSP